MPKGLLAMESIQMVGTHKTRDALGDCFRSTHSRKNTKIIQRINASIGGMGANDSRFAGDQEAIDLLL